MFSGSVALVSALIDGFSKVLEVLLYSTPVLFSAVETDNLNPPNHFSFSVICKTARTLQMDFNTYFSRFVSFNFQNLS